MTPEQLTVVRYTAVFVARADEEFAWCLEDCPGLIDAILELVATADDLDGFLTEARRLGRLHHEHGVHAADYSLVVDSLVAAVAEAAAEVWSPEADAAWRCMYALIVEAMLEGAEEDLFRRSG